MPLILAIDTGSAVASVALANDDVLLASRPLAMLSTAEALLPAVEAMLAEAEVTLAMLSGLVALRGPGSFTGLRIGMATVLGLHQALAVPATAVSTLAVLATSTADSQDDDLPTVAAVDALRGFWFVQRFPPRGSHSRLGLAEPMAEPSRVAASELAALAPARLVGFGVTSLPAELVAGLVPSEPQLLARSAAQLAASGALAWEPATLTAPLYLAPPAITLPKR